MHHAIINTSTRDRARRPWPGTVCRTATVGMAATGTGLSRSLAAGHAFVRRGYDVRQVCCAEHNTFNHLVSGEIAAAERVGRQVQEVA